MRALRMAGRVAIVLVMAWVVPARAEAQLASCSMSAGSVAFGSYNPLSILSTDTIGSVSFSCNVFALVPRLTLSRGSSSTFTPRTMQGPGGVLRYNLYLDPVHLLVWGDGSGGTTSFVAVGLVGAAAFFGSIPPNQNAPAGTYTDTLTVTIIF